MLAKAICRTENFSEEDSDVAAMAGILHETGKMILISKLPEQLEEAIKTSRSRQIPLYEVERDLTGVTHAELGGCLLELWGLPNSIIEAATFHHEPWQCPGDEFSIVSAVYAANVIDHQLCSSCGDGWFEGVNTDYLEQLSVIDRWPQWQKMHLPIEVEEHEYAR